MADNPSTPRVPTPVEQDADPGLFSTNFGRAFDGAPLRMIGLALGVLVGIAAIVIGVGMWSPPAAWIVGGLLFVAWLWLLLGDVT